MVAVCSLAEAQRVLSAYGFGGDDRLSGPVDRGLQGVLWRWDTAAGDRLAVKQTTAPLSSTQAHLAARLQRLADRAGVRSPLIRSTIDGAGLVPVGDGAFRVYAWVDLEAPDRDLDAATVGTALGRLHRCAPPVAGPVPDWYTDPVPPRTWTALVEALRERQAPFAADLAAALPVLDGLAELTRPVTGPFVLGHRDLWADNVRRDADGELVVIDWDNCGPVVPAQELAMVLIEFGTTPQRARQLSTAYLEAGGPGRVREPADFTMPAAILTRIVELGVRDWLSAPDDAGRAAAEQRVREFLEDPMTPALVADLLDAVAA